MNNKPTTQERKAAMLEALENRLGVVKLACDDSGTTRAEHEEWLATDPAYAAGAAAVQNVIADYAHSMLIAEAKKGNAAAIKMLQASSAAPRPQAPADPQDPAPAREPYAPEPEQPTRQAAEHPAEAKAAMLEALASNECMGIVQAAIQALGEAGWAIQRRLHAKWMKSDPAYADEVKELEIVGLEAQRDAVRMNILVQMADDPGVAKYLAQHICGIGAKESAPPTEKPADPFAGLSTKELQDLLVQMDKKGPKLAV